MEYVRAAFLGDGVDGLLTWKIEGRKTVPSQRATQCQSCRKRLADRTLGKTDEKVWTTRSDKGRDERVFGRERRDSDRT